MRSYFSKSLYRISRFILRTGYDTFHFLSVLDVVNILKKNLVIVILETNKVTDYLRIPFNGLPYILLAKQRYQCHQGEDIHKKI